MFKKAYFFYFLILFLISIIFSFSYSFDLSNSKYFWPTPNFTMITSNFGYRIHPITLKKSYHSGIDISVPEGTNIYSICDGIVSFVGFNGPYGFSIIVKSYNYEILYGHISPNFLINCNSTVKKGQLLAQVGPKYIDKLYNINYYDSSR